MNKEDLTYHADKGGYMLYYKGQPIGGAGTISKGGHLRGRAIASQIKSYGEAARYDINCLLSGAGQSRYKTAIEFIDQQNKTQ